MISPTLAICTMDNMGIFLFREEGRVLVRSKTSRSKMGNSSHLLLRLVSSGEKGLEAGFRNKWNSVGSKCQSKT